MGAGIGRGFDVSTMGTGWCVLDVSHPAGIGVGSGTYVVILLERGESMQDS